MREEDHAFVRLNDGAQLVLGRPTYGAVLNTAALVKPDDVGGVRLRAAPVGTAAGNFSLGLHLLLVLNQDDFVVGHFDGGGGWRRQRGALARRGGEKRKEAKERGLNGTQIGRYQKER